MKSLRKSYRSDCYHLKSEPFKMLQFSCLTYHEALLGKFIAGASKACYWQDPTLALFLNKKFGCSLRFMVKDDPHEAKIIPITRHDIYQHKILSSYSANGSSSNNQSQMMNSCLEYPGLLILMIPLYVILLGDKK